MAEQHRPKAQLVLIVAVALLATASSSALGFDSTKSTAVHDGAGGLSYTIPIPVPPGTAGMVPNLALAYSSQAGNGQMGVGWGISGLQTIERCPATINTDGQVGSVYLNNADRFCLNGRRLVKKDPSPYVQYGADGTEYRTEIESFTKIVSYGNAGGGPQWFKVWMQDSTILEFGNSADSQIQPPGMSVIRTWALNKLSDRSGNYYTVSYTKYATGEYTPLRIDYTGNANVPLAPYNSVQFTFGTRPDHDAYYVGTARINQDYRLTNVKTYTDATLVKDFRVTYDASPTSLKSRVASIQECAGDGVTCLGPINFAYSAGGGGMLVGNGAGLTDLGTSLFPMAPTWMQKGDFNGDGIQDVLIGGGGLLRICYGPAFTQCTDPFGDGGAKILVGDFNGDGISDLAKLYSWGRVQFCYGPNYPYTPCDQKDSGSFVNRDFIVGDFDGDGRDDIYMWQLSGIGDGFWCSATYAITWGVCNNVAPGPNGVSYKVMRGDFDGDGVADLLFVGATQYVICAPITNCWAKPLGQNWRDYDSLVIGDFNGDGKSDLLVVDAQGLLVCQGPDLINSPSPCTWSVYGSDWYHTYQPLAGDFNADGYSDLLLGSAAGTFICKGPGILSGNNCVQVNSLQWSGTNMVAADFTGDASDDVIVFGYDGHFRLGKGGDGNGATTALPDLMTYATKYPSGATTAFIYKPLTNTSIYIPGTGAVYPVQDFHGPRYVLSQLVYPNGAGGYSDKTFGYKKGLNHFTHRDFMGYETVWEVDSGTGLRVETTRAQSYPNLGRVTDITTRVNGTTDIVKHQVRTLGTVQSFEGRDSSAIVSDVITSAGLNGEWQSDYIRYTYDSYGNVYVKQYAKDEASYPYYFKKQEFLSYQNDASQWLFGAPMSRSLTLWNEEGLTVSQSTTFTTYPGTRLIQTETREPNVAAYTVTTTYTRDVMGNAFSTSISAAGVETRTTSYGYDSRGRFVTSTTNPMGHVTGTTYDPKFGGLLSQTDPNNLTTSWQYDGFGRKTLESRPDGTQTTWAYEVWGTCCYGYALSPYQVKRIREQKTGESSPTYTSYDMLDRVVLVQKRNFADNGWIYTKNIWYNAAGKIDRSYLPYEDSQAVKPYEHMLYDALGRVETKFDGASHATSYIYSSGPTTANNTTTIRNSRTYDTAYVRSPRGQLRQVIDPNGKTTSYQYAPTGQLSLMTDALGNQTTYVYDNYGRLTSRTDPDLGTWTFTNDRIGQLITQVDAKNQTTNFTYDKLGRKTTRGEPTTVATWTWDTATKGVGRIASSTAVWAAGNFVRSYTYDSFSRPASETITYPGGGAYTISTAYDSASRPLTLTYPSGFTVKSVYNTAGYLAEVRNNANNALFWKANVVTAAGITDEDYGNGTGVSRVFDAYTQQLNQIAVLRDSDNASLQGFNYSYDVVGNIASRTETSQNVPETFAYDGLDRLTIVNHNTLPSAYKTFTYDDIGNLTAKSDVGTYSYPTTGKVHAVSNVAGTSYVYDSNGNIINTGYANFNWSVSNFPTSVTAGAWTYSWAYDADNNRTRFIGPSETRLYFGRGTNLLYELVTASTTDQRHYIYANGAAVAQYTTRSSGVNDTRYFYRDHLGSVTLIADETGNVTERLSYDASGKRRFPNGADDTGNTLAGGATDLGFAGHEQLEEIGLIHMNGRLYDPRIGRFISADPTEPSIGVVQSFNRYTYGANNANRYVDPTGYTNCSVIRCHTWWISGYWQGPAGGQWVDAFSIGPSGYGPASGTGAVGGTSAGGRAATGGSGGGGIGSGAGAGAAAPGPTYIDPSNPNNNPIAQGGYIAISGVPIALLPQLPVGSIGLGGVSPSAPGSPAAPASSSRSNTTHRCQGPARILAGNPGHVGQQGGFPGTLVGSGTAAIAFEQWGGSNPAIRPYIGSIQGETVAGQPLFSGVTEVIGGHRQRGYPNDRVYLLQRYPGALLIELVTGSDMGTQDVIITLDINAPCPTNTAELLGP